MTLFLNRPAPHGKVTLRRVRLNGGGYDSAGGYWGCGAPLYAAEDDCGFSDTFRAANRPAAKAKLRAAFPHGSFTFYR